MTVMVRRSTPRFDAEDVTAPQRLLRALNEFSTDIASRLAAMESRGRVVVLDDIIFEIGAALGVNSAPFPIRVQTPFGVAGAWVVLCECTSSGEAGIATAGVMAWCRPVSGAPDGSGTAVEIQFVTGLTANRKYRLRLAVVGVKNG